MLSNKTVINTTNTQPVCYVLLLLHKDMGGKKNYSKGKPFGRKLNSGLFTKRS